ncbi:phosphoenolpyruvate carboxylase [Puia dinghuensis]|uniref:Phosphoenolpyruvate carboxylase n=1 Tax=Puia dinghuensis TaxID=1792502 RepID=A0A8J2XVX4_9BACT|nr:phosphoenolpyruvate carboxylase [Puia dinghuensis]GGB15233.1 phosphoenolpyruvate carboxylase [Puia dinghuensis]
MNYQPSQGLAQFKNLVGIKFQLYNSLFTSLPFHRIEKTGILLSLLLTICEDGYKKKQSPEQILEDFFRKHTACVGEREKADTLFRFVQYVERQIVLFDALEDAAFRFVNDMSGAGTMKHLLSEVIQTGKEEELTEKLTDYSVRLVLTAHPTQFYPGAVLGIINDLSRAVIENNAADINLYLQQLGKTPFLKKQRPTPYDEAISLIWYLENVFYQASGRIISALKDQFPDAVNKNNALIKMGFWPGGDRDGNPFVKADTTLRVAEALRGAIVKCYYLDVRRLKRRLTFKGVDVLVADLEQKLYNNIFVPGLQTELTREEILEQLTQIREIIIYQHNSLFLGLVDNLIGKVMIFGLHFATLDIRQDSSVHGGVLMAIAAKERLVPEHYASLPDARKLELLTELSGEVKAELYDDPLVKDTLDSIAAMKTIQRMNGENGCSRYIISQCTSAVNVLEVMGLYLLCGWTKEELTVDIVPLFETVDDLQAAAGVMKTLYEHKDYRQHLQRRGHTQTIMLGFSDGTKDGGYLMANWAIYKAKEELTAISKEYGVDVVFFDGRGGPPARGGGKTHKFYASMGKNIANKQIQLTIQGQTVSSNFGTIDSAQYNIEQLIHAGISNELFSSKEVTLQPDEEELLQALSVESYKAYSKLKEHPYFLSYLNEVSPLRFYSETNIASRPTKRKSGGRLELKDLRAIPFVGSWSQLKQNVTGYYGVGKALQCLDKQGKWAGVKRLYENSLFFKTLLDNCEMAMKKCFFPLTEHFAVHPVYGEIWTLIYDEFELTQKYIFKLSGKNELMADYPVEQLSIQMRERIALPLNTIQQYALTKFQAIEKSGDNKPMKEVYEKLIMRSSFGIINAARNSA